MPIRLLLVDDHAMMRQGLRALLERSPELVIVGEAVNGREALACARELNPDVVLLDITMPEMSGLDALPRLMRLTPPPGVILLSMHVGEQHVIAGIQAGASGYLPKNASFEQLFEAIQAVAAGKRYLPPSMSGILFDTIARTGDPKTEYKDPIPLTPRQREVLQLIGEGRSSREIAERLHRSEKTIEAIRAQIRSRLAIQDTAGLVRYAVRMGLVSPD